MMSTTTQRQTRRCSLLLFSARQRIQGGEVWGKRRGLSSLAVMYPARLCSEILVFQTKKRKKSIEGCMLDREQAIRKAARAASHHVTQQLVIHGLDENRRRTKDRTVPDTERGSAGSQVTQLCLPLQQHNEIC